jgi:adenine deaminase
LFDNTDPVPGWARGRIHLPPDLHAGSFTLPATPRGRGRGRGATVADGDGDGLVVAEIVMPGAGEPCVRPVSAEPTVSGGMVVADPGRDLLKVAVIDRAGLAGAPCVGVVRGVGLRRGAVGVSANRDPGNVIVVGVNDDDMVTAATALEGMGGGFVAVDRGWVRAACPLPVAGVMSDAPWEAVVGELDALDAALAALECWLPSPFGVLAALGDALLVNCA